MVYNLNLLYRILDTYVKNDMGEEEHGFITGIKWSDNHSIGNCPEEFWTEIQEAYEIHLSESDIRSVATVGDLKRLICSSY